MNVPSHPGHGISKKSILKKAIELFATLYSLMVSACTSFYNLSAVAPIFQEAPSLVSKRIENELRVTQSLVWKYTAVLEKITYSDTEPGLCNIPIVLLREALYNMRQHELFLKVLLVRVVSCILDLVL